MLKYVYKSNLKLLGIYVGLHMGLHKMVKNLGNNINAIQNFFDKTTDYESRGQGFESSRAHHNLASTLKNKKSYFNYG